jgi:hypothetical protein
VLRFDDRDDLAFGDDIVEFDQYYLDFPCCRRRYRDFHFHGFDERNLVAVTDTASGFNGKRTHAAGDIGDNLDLWHSVLPGPSDGLIALANGFLLWPQIA